MKQTKHLVLLALFVSQALILSIIESWIAIPSPVPGVKLGLANIITLVTIVFFSLRDVLGVVTVRTLLGSLLGGGLVLFPFSFAGGLLSGIVMYILYKKTGKSFSLLGISIAGAITHNLGQLAVAAVMTGGFAVFGYLPVLMVSGIVMGCFIGLVTNLLINALKKTRMFV
ncbi:MAG: Gx transporter family protein [Ruminiclostridium sp.]|nr:Gx transporter family protein [Ruminiclostridium sp.]